MDAQSQPTVVNGHEPLLDSGKLDHGTLDQGTLEYGSDRDDAG